MERSEGGARSPQRGVVMLFGAASILALLAAAPAVAQTAAQTQGSGNAAPTPLAAAASPKADAPDAPNAIGEVVVTARRRAESLDKVPVSVSVLGPTELAEKNVFQQQDLQKAVPGLVLRGTQNAQQLNYSLRGQSIDAFSGAHAAVLTYTNDVQITNQSASSLYDLEAVQVLKGPQGTLFGRNVTGGAVLYNTAKPKEDFGGFATVRLGDYGLREFQGAVNAPLIGDKVLFRLAGDFVGRDGFQHNSFDGQDYGSQDRQSVRASLIVRPTEKLQNLTVLEIDRSKGDNVNPIGWSAYPCGAPPNAGFALKSNAACLFGPTLDANISSPGAWNRYLAAHPNIPTGGLVNFIQQQRSHDPWNIDIDAPNFHTGRSYFVTNTTTYDLTDALQIKNILGYAFSRSRDAQDKDGTPYAIQLQSNGRGLIGNQVSTSQGSDELQLLGKALDNKLSFVIGAYYAFEQDSNFQDSESFDLTPVRPAPAVGDTDYRTGSWTQAIYAQGTYDLSSITGIHGLSFTGGLRYSWDEEHITPFAGSRNFGPPEAADFSDPSWQVGLEFQVNPNLLLYVENRGSWRAGGFNGSSPPVLKTASGGGNLFLSEETYDVEVGAKFNGEVLGHRSRLNIALYDQWISNVQRAVYLVLPSGLSSITANIPQAEVKGVEFDAETNVTRWLQLGLTAALTDAEYTSPTVNLFSQNFTVGPYGDAPKLSGSFYTQVSLPMPEAWGELSARASLYAQTSQYFTNFGNTTNPGARLPGYGLLDLRLDWRNIHGTNTSLSAFVRNAADKPYYIGGTALGAAFGLNVAIPGEPRMFGVELGYKF